MQAIVAAFAMPLMLLNLLGGIISGLWLAILGEWNPLLIGVLGCIVSPFLLGIVLIPNLLLAAPAILLIERNKNFSAMILFLLSQIYIYSVVVVWCLMVFYFFISKANYETFWPLLIWSYGVATGPWSYFAQKDNGNASFITTFFAQFSYFVMGICAVFYRPYLDDCFVIFSALMCLGMLLHSGFGFAMLKYERRLSL